MAKLRFKQVAISDLHDKRAPGGITSHMVGVDTRGRIWERMEGLDGGAWKAVPAPVTRTKRTPRRR